ncbi:hypothetical protein TNCV_615771 [Trichonephila clavipes]|nr:hypothetical protein TNCV_615771 [Trichonephila clavipes]
MSSSLVPLMTRREKELMYVKSRKAETSSRWRAVELRGGGCQLRCYPRLLTMDQNDEVRRQNSSSRAA